MNKKYKAFVIDGRRIIKNTASALIGIAASVAVIFGARFSGLKVEILQVSEQPEKNYGERLSAFFQDIFNPFEIISGEIAFLDGHLGERGGKQEEAAMVFNETNADIEAALPKQGIVVGLSGELPISEIDSSQKKAVGLNEVLIKNETNYSVNPTELLNERLGLDMSKSGPKILIVHTHGSESYTPSGQQFYVEGTGDRNKDTSFNVVHVGDKITEIFERAGIEVIHDRKVHDIPSYNGSYASSLSSIEKYIGEYPSIQIVLDIHRDAIVYSDGTKAKTVTEIDGKNAAQLMFVVGTNQGGLTHDNWRENLKLAVKLQNAINKKYPSLMRGINLRRERFNGHMTKGSLIIEVGTSGNTLEEAVLGASYASEVIAEFINGL